MAESNKVKKSPVVTEMNGADESPGTNSTSNSRRVAIQEGAMSMLLHDQESAQETAPPVGVGIKVSEDASGNNIAHDDTDKGNDEQTNPKQTEQTAGANMKSSAEVKVVDQQQKVNYDSQSPPSKRRKIQDNEGVFDDANGQLGAVAATGDLDDDRKPAAKKDNPAESIEKCNMGDDNNNNKVLPLAPSLDEYLKSGGHAKYSPRPEWYHSSNESNPGTAAYASNMHFLQKSSWALDAGGVMMESSTSNSGNPNRIPLMPVGGEGIMRAADPSASARFQALEAAAAHVSQRLGGDPLVAIAIHEDGTTNAGDARQLGAALGDAARSQGWRDIVRAPRHPAPRRAPPVAAPAAGMGEGTLAMRQMGDALGRHFGFGNDVGQQHNNAERGAGHHHRRRHRAHNGNRRGDQHQIGALQDLPNAMIPTVGPHPVASMRSRQQQQQELFRRQHQEMNNSLANAANSLADVRMQHQELSNNLDNDAFNDLQMLLGNNDVGGGNNVVGDGPAARGGGEESNPNAAADQEEVSQQRHNQAVEGNIANNDQPESPAAASDSAQQQQNDHASGDSTIESSSPKAPPTPHPSSPSKSNNSKKVAVFGYECDSALHLAIKQRSVEAALDLIRAGACINFPNAKGITPLMIASQEGSLPVVTCLLSKGALPNATTIRGSTALIQACHFGKLDVAEELLGNGALVDQSNLKNTTALMRASQEGHEHVVRLLLLRNAGVNRRNDERMTALMLSSQRGHPKIVEMLVKAGAQVDAKTAQDSTSLMLACKRKHLNVAKILVASGTELKLKDCKNRTVLETAARRGNEEFAKILTDDAQVRLMQKDSRRERNFAMVRVWKLLQSERAKIRLSGGVDVTIHTVAETMLIPPATPTAIVPSVALLRQNFCPSKQVLINAMTLPAPLIELISSFIPLPLIWEKRLMLLTSRSHIDPDSAVFNALDLIDEVLEVGGILEAFDTHGVSPPSTFDSWSQYKAWCGKCDILLSRCANADVTSIFAQVSDVGIEIVESLGSSAKNLRQVEPSQTQRRACNYLQVLARAPQSLSRTLSSHPYDMSSALFEKLKSCHDIQSVVRRFMGGGIHFDTSIANEMVVMARMAVMWCESRPMY